LDLAQGAHEFPLGKQVQAFFVNIIGLHLIFEVVPQFLAFTPAFDTGVLQVVESLVEVVERNFVAENARGTLGFAIRLTGFRGQSHRRDVARTQILFGFTVMLLGSRPAGFHLDDFFVEGDCDLVIALVEGLFRLIHHALGFRVVRGLEEAPQGVAIDAGIEFGTQVGAGQRRNIRFFRSLLWCGVLENGFSRRNCGACRG